MNQHPSPFFARNLWHALTKVIQGRSAPAHKTVRTGCPGRFGRKLRLSALLNVTVGLLSAALLFSAWPVAAAEKDGKEQLRSLQLRVRQAEQAKTQIAQEKAELDDQVKASEHKLQQTKRDADVAERKRAASVKELNAAVVEKAELADQLVEREKLLSEVQTKLEQSNTALGKTSELLSRSESNNRALVGNLAKKTQALTESTDKNEQLFKVGESLMAELAANGGGARLQSEPVTGLARVALENKVETYRDQLELQRLNRQQVAEQEQRRLVAQRIEAQQSALAEPENRRLEQERARENKLKQQARLDSWTHKITSFFDNLEW